MENFGGYIKHTAEKFWQLSLPLRIGVVVVLILLGGFILQGGDAPKVVDGESLRAVTLASVGDLSLNVSPLSLLGTVTSRSEATIRAEGGGKIVGVYRKLGDYVGAGAVIAEFENAAERAGVLQAEGAYESASLGKDIASISRGSSDNALIEAKTQARNVIAAAYTGLDDAIRTKTDPAWRNPLTRDAKLAVTIADAKLVIELEAARTNLETTLREREARNHAIAQDGDLVGELTAIEREVNTTKSYLDDLSLAFNRALADNNASQAAIEGYKMNTALARSSIGGILSSITNARNGLNASLSATQIAEKTGSIGGSDTGSSADAGVKSALGNLRGAQARLEKTVIRSPISGTINSLAISTGDFVSPFTEVAVVSNNGALEVVAHVTEDDAKELGIGGKVTIEGGIAGVVTRIAPALDPKTKKIEVRVGIIGNASTLINGQSVRIEVARAEKKSTALARSGTIQIPLSALKITPTGTMVFTVSASSTLVEHPVKEGALLGSKIVIVDGLTEDMKIVTDARGLQNGMSVLVQ